jgi:Protein of unknown function (DUF2510)
VSHKSALSLAEAPPPDEGNPSPGYYPDPLGSVGLREWDGARWTQTVRQVDPTLAKPASAYTQHLLVVPRVFPYADPYVINDQADGGKHFEVPGGRWFFRQLRVLDAGGVEVARLRRKDPWWLPEPRGHHMIFGETEGAIIPYGLNRYSLRVSAGVRTAIIGDRKGNMHSFIGGREGRLVARLTKRGSRERDLEVAQDTDPVPIVAACVAIDQNRRRWSGPEG